MIALLDESDFPKIRRSMIVVSSWCWILIAFPIDFPLPLPLGAKTSINHSVIIGLSALVFLYLFLRTLIGTYALFKGLKIREQDIARAREIFSEFSHNAQDLNNTFSHLLILVEDNRKLVKDLREQFKSLPSDIADNSLRMYIFTIKDTIAHSLHDALMVRSDEHHLREKIKKTIDRIHALTNTEQSGTTPSSTKAAEDALEKISAALDQLIADSNQLKDACGIKIDTAALSRFQQLSASMQVYRWDEVYIPTVASLSFATVTFFALLRNDALLGIKNVFDAAMRALF